MLVKESTKVKGIEEKQDKKLCNNGAYVPTYIPTSSSTSCYIMGYHISQDEPGYNDKQPSNFSGLTWEIFILD